VHYAFRGGATRFSPQDNSAPESRGAQVPRRARLVIDTSSPASVPPAPRRLPSPTPERHAHRPGRAPRSRAGPTLGRQPSRFPAAPCRV